jgi:hypothetical protein
MMGWASDYIRCLKQGKTVIFRPKGRSMEPIILSGELVTVEPCPDTSVLDIGDIVLCTIKNREFLHVIKAVSEQGFLIGNNRGGVNGCVKQKDIHGKLVRVEK